MIVISGALVLVALVLLVIGVPTAGITLVYGSIGASVLALLFLGVGVLQRRGGLAQGDGISDGVGEQGSGSDRPDAGVTAPADETTVEPGAVATVERAEPVPFPSDVVTSVPVTAPTADSSSTQAEDDGQDLPDPVLEPEESDEVEYGGPVLVVPGRPRYHVRGCRYLANRVSDEIDVFDARDDGFVPCGVCKPDRVLKDEYLAEVQGDGGDGAAVPEPQPQPQPQPEVAAASAGSRPDEHADAPRMVEDPLPFEESDDEQPETTAEQAGVPATGAQPVVPGERGQGAPGPVEPLEHPKLIEATEPVGQSSEGEPELVEPVAETPQDEPELVEPVAETPQDEPELVEPVAETPQDEPELVEPVAETPLDEPESVEPIGGTPDDAPELVEPVAETPHDEPESVEPTGGTPDDAPESVEPVAETPQDEPELVEPVAEPPVVPELVEPAPDVPDPELVAPAGQTPDGEVRQTEPVAERPDAALVEPAGQAPGEEAEQVEPAEQTPDREPAQVAEDAADTGPDVEGDRPVPAAASASRKVRAPGAVRVAGPGGAVARPASPPTTPAPQAPRPASRGGTTVRVAPSTGAGRTGTSRVAAPGASRAAAPTQRAAQRPSPGPAERTVGPAPTSPSPGDTPVVVMADAGRFHQPACRYVRGVDEPATRSRAHAVSEGLQPCGVCRP